ncbi:MAG: DUF2169 domain-containing protein [Planctomycetes bacterium]|nr:DUF2169 domain-containing protein [Planctomycetota bacterium]
MKVRNRTDFKFAPMLGQVNWPAHSVSCVVKAGFRFVHGGVAVPLEKHPEIEGDIRDNTTGAPLYESDLGLFKPRADLLLTGTCYAPGGKAVTTCPVKFQVGNWARELAVIGNRHWDKGLVFSRQSEPEPFTRCALHWGNAFGGEGFAENPVGKGFKSPLLPNIELPGKLIKGVGDKPHPAGFGPLDRTWKQRAGRMGSYDKKWLKERWPALPADFDWGYFNAAPEDQQLEGFLRGDETVTLTNLHPEIPVQTCTLPGLRVRVFVRLRHEGKLELHEVPMHLDTLHVDADAGLMRLVWRGVQNTRASEFEDIEDFLVFSEPLAATPAAREQILPWFEDPPLPVEPVAPPPPAEGALPAEAGNAVLEAMQELVKSQQAEMTKRSRGAVIALAPGVFEGFAPMVASMLELKARLVRAGQPVPPTLDQAIHQFQSDPALQQVEGDLLIQQALAAAAKAAPLAGAALALAIKGNTAPTRDHSGQNLDGMDLSGADLTHCDFRNASLKAANLSGCKVEYANFGNADLSGANLSGIKGQRPDFTRANAGGANFEKAEIPQAVFVQANLSSASLKAATAPDTNFYEANAARLSAPGAALDGADFTQAKLDGADLAGAKLAKATLLRAGGQGLNLKGAQAPNLRAEEARLENLVADEAELADATFERANLQGASFRFAGCANALFSGANLHKAVLFGATLRRAFLRKANLAGAQAGNADFFQANLERANLKGASFIASNLYECATHQAELENTDLSQANIKMTLLAK